MKLYSIVLLDIDGTLLDSHDQISPNTKKLLCRLEQRGIPVILCSSRPPSGVEMVTRQCGLQKSPMICYGGSLILDRDCNILEDTGIDRDTALRFREYAVRKFPDVAVTSYLYDIWLVDSVQDPYVASVIRRYGYRAIEGSLEDAVRSGRHVHKIMCMGKSQSLKALQSEAAPLFPALSLAASGATFLEITAAGVSKYTAMERIREYYHVPLDRMAAAGDYYVDMEMLRHAGLGIAMGNAPEAVKAAAARVTATNDEEGVYIALKNVRFRPPEPPKPEAVNPPDLPKPDAVEPPEPPKSEAAGDPP